MVAGCKRAVLIEAVVAEQTADAVARIVEVLAPLLAAGFAEVLVDRTMVAVGAADNGAPVALPGIVLLAAEEIGIGLFAELVVDNATLAEVGLDMDELVALVADNAMPAEVVFDIGELAALLARSLAGMD